MQSEARNFRLPLEKRPEGEFDGQRGKCVESAGNAEAVLAEVASAGVYDPAFSASLQREGTAAFAKSWNELMRHIASKRGLP